MRDDLRAAVRSLNSSKTFTAVALVVLTLGIGATTAIFSVVDAVVLRGLPFDEHDRLVAIGERRPPNPDFQQQPNPDPEAVSAASPQNYMDWAARQEVFESMAAVTNGLFALRAPGVESQELRGQRVTASFFEVLRRQPQLGRAFSIDNETEGRHQVAVLSHGLWVSRFGADPDVIGTTMPIDGGPYEIVGVMPPDFEYPVGAVQRTELWVPYVVPADERIRNPRRVSIYLSGVARLKPGVSLAQAQANLDRISDALTSAHPEWNKNTRAGIRPLLDHIVGARTRQWMMLLLGAVSLVLLIACANVANLLLARASAREREIGIRAAIGAGRGRLLRQLMIESFVLSALGTVLAVLLAWWVVAVLKASMPDGVPRVAAIAIDLRVLGAAAVISLVTAVLFGGVPAMQSSRTDVTSALKEGARGSATKARIRSALIVLEVALAVVLLIGAALFIGSFRALMSIDPGLDPQNVLTLSVVPPLQVASPAEVPDFAPAVQQIVQRVQQISGVVSAGAISGGLPLGGSMSVSVIDVPGRTLSSDERSISVRRVTPDYFAAIGMQLDEGRVFTLADARGSEPVIIINESAARLYFPNESAVGKIVTVSGKTPQRIVGVVGNVYQRSLETEPRTEAYLPLTQGRVLFSELVVKTAGNPYGVLPAVKAAVVETMPAALTRNVRTLEEVIERLAAPRRFNMLLLGLFGLLGLVIAAVGVYGVMAYIVAQRTREIGVRMALGATRRSVVAMVLRNATLLVACGLTIGGLAAYFFGSTAESFLFRIDTRDPRVFAVALGTLALAALLASVIPAHRAARVDPTEALRAE